VSVFGGISHSPSSVNLRLTQTSPSSSQASKKKRSWSRAVFSNLQRKGLEKRFEVQKYVTKPDRRQLAAMLGLTDAQVRYVAQVHITPFFLSFLFFLYLFEIKQRK